MISPNPQSARRNHALDILRGIAILIVVLHHTEPLTIPGLPELSGAIGFAFWRFRMFGSSGIDLFFNLSGFLVGGLLIKELAKYQTINFPRFFLRRGFKIWPSYFVLLAVLAIFVPGAENWLFHGEPWRNLFVHGLFLNNYLDQTHNTPLWTLAIEEHFYLLLPLVLSGLVWLGGLRKIGHLAVFMLLLCLGLRVMHLRLYPHDGDFMLTHNRMDGLFFGVFLAWAWSEFPDQIRAWTRHRWLMLGIVFALVSPSFFFARKSPFLFSIGFTMLTLGYGLLLITAVAQGLGKFGDSLLGRGIQKVGFWSYNIYLWHFFLPVLLAPVYRPAQFWLSRCVPSPVIVLLLQVGFYVSLCIVAGWFFTRFVEGPFLRLRDKVLPSRTGAIPQA